MSANPKRGPQEEGGHLSSSSVRPNYVGEEESHGHSRVNYSPIRDNRPLPRLDSRDGERRSPLHSMYRMPSLPVSDSRSPHASHPVVGPEVRMESRDSKEIRESKGVENNREVKVEPRDVNHQSGKVEKEGRIENRIDESKEAKYERERGNDSKSEVKVEKDASLASVAGPYPNWKDPHRGKRNSEILGGGVISGAWNSSSLRAKYEASKEIPMATTNIVKVSVEGSEAVGENKVDSKADDKYNDRKRKEGKHYDWPESDKDKSDYRSNLPPGSSTNNDYKEGTREEREFNHRESEKKEIVKDKERLKEREKEHVDKEGKSERAKESYLNEKDVADKPSVQENSTLESKKPSDSWRNLEREAKERRKERDGDVEGERPEKRRYFEKESDEGVADVGEGTDKERNAFNYGVQQKKRMLRARGSPQVGYRDARLKSREQDDEG